MPGQAASVALVHPWLTNMGGSERVLLRMHDAYPDAPVYTSVYQPAAMPAFAGVDVRTSFLQRWPAARTRHQLYPLLRPRAFARFDLRGYDVVLSSCSAEAKGVRTPPETLHVAYIHTPVRYYWSDYERYLADPGFGRLDPLARRVLPRAVARLRALDLAAAARPDHLVANSRYVAARIERYYGRSATVIHPPVEVDRFTVGRGPRHGLLVVSRLIPYKRVDLAVLAARELDRPLTVVGTGPELPRLQALAGPRTRFLGALDDAAVARELAAAEALVFSADEDFGIVPLEAMAAGTPVVAYGRGGALETVVDGVTGVLHAEQTVASLRDALTRLDPAAFDRDALRRHAEGFAPAVFTRRLTDFVAERLAEHRAAGGRAVAGAGRS